jgi:hypothetical protein
MTLSVYKHPIMVVCLMVFAGCATYSGQKVGPTPIQRAQTEIPEEQLLDVGSLVFESDELTEEDIEDEGTNNDIRKSETHYMPYHLKNTLHQSSHWGAVQVVPAETDSVDLLIKGKIVKSNGERLVLKINVVDTTGKNWMSKTYSADATQAYYAGNKVGEKDAFQDIYNTIANDMAELRGKLTADEIAKIRTVSKLKFAKDFAPDAFGDYLTKNKKGTITLNRLPADNDPMMDRLLKIREREYLYVDTLNQLYDGFYNEMWPSYENWRKMNLTERKAMQKIKRDAMMRQIGGALMIAAAIAAGTQNSTTARTLAPAIAIMGGQVLISGFNVSKEAQIHSAAIKELSESFGDEMQPVVMEFEGQRYELTGPAEEQFKRWRELLRNIYITETGFNPDTPTQDQTSD